jgi:hypothetical protein
MDMSHREQDHAEIAALAEDYIRALMPFPAAPARPKKRIRRLGLMRKLDRFTTGLSLVPPKGGAWN